MNEHAPAFLKASLRQKKGIPGLKFFFEIDKNKMLL